MCVFNLKSVLFFRPISNEELTVELVSHDKNILLTEWQFQQTEDCHQILFTLLHLEPFTGLTTESTAQLITKQNI